jgi:hypothetical protein
MAPLSPKRPLGAIPSAGISKSPLDEQKRLPDQASPTFRGSKEDPLLAVTKKNNSELITHDRVSSDAQIRDQNRRRSSSQHSAAEPVSRRNSNSSSSNSSREDTVPIARQAQEAWVQQQVATRSKVADMCIRARPLHSTAPQLLHAVAANDHQAIEAAYAAAALSGLDAALTADQHGCTALHVAALRGAGRVRMLMLRWRHDQVSAQCFA